MANRILHSFDYLSTAGLAGIMTTQNGAINTGTGIGPPRTGAAQLAFGFNPSGDGLIPLGSNEGTLTMGFGFKANGFGNNYALGFSDGATVQCGLNIGGAGVFQAYLPGGGGSLASIAVCTLNVYNYVEIRVVFGNPGTYTMYVNGVLAYQNNSVRTTQTANNFANNIIIAGSGGGIVYAIDDLYVNDASGPNNNSFMGAIRVYPVVPSSDATPLLWTPSTAGAHFSKVNNLASGTATNVSDPTIGDVDQYGFTTAGLPAGTIVKAMQLNLYAGLDAAGSRSITARGQQGVTAVDFAPSLVLSATSPRYGHWNFDLDPVTGGGLTFGALNNSTFGPKVTV